jgi:sugar-phosphatase
MRDLEAVIFDMDGVLIDSEGLWRRAMIEGFGEAGVTLTEDECRETMGRRFSDVVALWLTRKRTDRDAAWIEARVTNLLMDLIGKEGKAIEGAPEILQICAKHGLSTGLATSSSSALMQKVLETLALKDSIHEAVSAEHMKYAKPHPEVFLVCAEKLGVRPENCLVIEDSLNGVIAAKAARMKVIAVPDEGFRASQQFAIADFKAYDMREASTIVRKLLGG